VLENTYPFESVVQLTGTGIPGCTALKIGPTRFLTAAHCLDSATTGGLISTCNALDAGFNFCSAGTIANVFIHPSYAADPDASSETVANHSYDVALIDTTAQTNIPVANGPYWGHISDGSIGAVGPHGGRGLFVGYGCNPITPSPSPYKQSAHFNATSLQVWQASGCDSCGGDDFPLYTRNILSIETGGAREGTCSGDSGGPLFRYSSADGSYRVVGVSSVGVNDVASDNPVHAGFTRLNNVKGWLAAPHKLNVITPFELGFLLNRAHRRCAAIADGGGTTLFECDGRNQPNDDQYWQLLQVPSTNFFQIRNVLHGTCLSAGTGSVNVTQASCTAGTNTHWAFSAPGAAKQIKITHRTLNRCLTGQANVFDPLRRNTCDSTQAQDW
jgi:hypothetical protein